MTVPDSVVCGERPVADNESRTANSFFFRLSETVTMRWGDVEGSL
jgi:hypothetical protein